MENGIDLNEIPGEKAAIGERIQSNFPKKNRSSPRRNNDFVDVEPIRNVQQFIDRFQKPRVHVPEIRKPPRISFTDQIQFRHFNQMTVLVCSIICWCTRCFCLGDSHRNRWRCSLHRCHRSIRCSPLSSSRMISLTSCSSAGIFCEGMLEDLDNHSVRAFY